MRAPDRDRGQSIVELRRVAHHARGQLKVSSLASNSVLVALATECWILSEAGFKHVGWHGKGWRALFAVFGALCRCTFRCKAVRVREERAV